MVVSFLIQVYSLFTFLLIFVLVKGHLMSNINSFFEAGAGIDFI